jgi:GntR family transcriptional regulator
MQAGASYFQVNPSSGMPIYRQLMDQVRALVASGRLAEGDLLPSVRQVGQDLQVNQMTVSKAYSLLERDTAHTRQPDVQDQAPGAVRIERRQEGLGAVGAGGRPGIRAPDSEQVLAALDPLLKERGNE